MKAEINNENKAKFFALYWGQEVYGWENGVTTGFVSLNVNETEFLILKPLSSISDENKKVVTVYYNTNLIKIDEYGGFEPWDDGDFIPWRSIQIDYLRSKGYALPYLGLSVEDLINAGWIKLIES
jgi:hypothetical protein